MANTYQSINLNGNGGGGSNPPYSSTFLIATWSLNGSVYEIDIPEATHGRGAEIVVQVFELTGGVYKEVEVDIEITSAGNITIIVDSDLRFDGKINITGE